MYDPKRKRKKSKARDRKEGVSFELNDEGRTKKQKLLEKK
jgi:hypothetical protein